MVIIVRAILTKQSDNFDEKVGQKLSIIVAQEDAIVSEFGYMMVLNNKEEVNEGKSLMLILETVASEWCFRNPERNMEFKWKRCCVSLAGEVEE